MIKIAVFDSGYGGENFADKIESELPIIKVIRVIDWRHAEQINISARLARKAAEEALRPYIGSVDLIIFANHLLTITSLKYFRRKYQNQKFIGINLTSPDNYKDRSTLILATNPVTKTYHYHRFVFNLHCPNITICLNSWPQLIDDGELSKDMIKYDVKKHLIRDNFQPTAIILACSHFSDIKAELKSAFGSKVKIYDGFQDTIREACKILKIRGGIGKKKT